ncbi:hypothetical protein [Paraburkholderia sp. SIMBA_030]|uniref:hypothetical protein n=1 Tax=Paraburkholderia sp. SIMBA_030 TaxID=3085773 RepID=UPI00397B2D5C
MSSSIISALTLQLERRYVVLPTVDAPPADPTAPVRDTRPLVRRRRRRGSALDACRSIVESYIRRRARARNRSAYTYARLARLIERRSGRHFSISTIQRRMVVWGIVDGMERYKK